MLLIDLEIKLHRCCFFFGSLCYPLCWSSTWSAPVPCPAPQVAFWGSGNSQSVTPQMLPRSRADWRLQGAFLLMWARNYCISPIYTLLSVSFFVRAALKTWLLVRNNSFGIFLEKCVSLLVWFSLCVVRVFWFLSWRRKRLSALAVCGTPDSNTTS